MYASNEGYSKNRTNTRRSRAFAMCLWLLDVSVEALGKACAIFKVEREYVTGPQA